MKRPLSQRLTAARHAALAVAAMCAASGAHTAVAIQPPTSGPTCTVSAGSAIAFGAYDPFSPAPLDSVGTLTLDCPIGQVATVTLGTGQAGTFSPRALRGPGGAALGYNLYLDAQRTRVWGDGTGGTFTGPFDSRKGKQVSIFARAFAGQDVPAGAYADTVVVTVEF